MRLLPIAFIALAQIAQGSEETPEIVLSGPEITKLDWGVRALAQGDVDGDGREDIAVINNDRARVEILYQRDPNDSTTQSRPLKNNRWKPVLEDSRFDREGVASGVAMYDLALGDVTGDGRTDVIFTSKDEPLVVVPQLEDGLWGEKRQFDGFEALPWQKTLQLVELSDRYEGLELVLLSKDQLLVFAFDEDGAPVRLHEAHRTDSNGTDLTVLSATNNEPLRFAYRVAGSSRALRVVDWDSVMGMGAEKAFALDASTPDWGWIDRESSEPALLMIEPRIGRLRVEALSPAKSGNQAEWPLEYYSTGATAESAQSYAWGDFTGDGIADMAVADSANAQVWLLQGRRGGGWNAPRSFPSFQGVDSLCAAKIDGANQDTLLVISKKESSLGVMRWNGERLEFPQSIGISSDPKQMIWVPDAQQLVVLVADDSDYSLIYLSPENGQWIAGESIPLKDVRREPSGFLVADLDQNGKDDLLIAVPRDAARYVDFSLVESLAPDEMTDAVTEIEGLRDLDLTSVGLGDVDSDGNEELLVASEGFVRVIRLNKEKRREVIDQYNARSGNDRVMLPQLRNIDEDPEIELLLFDQRARDFQILERDDAGIFRYARSVQFGSFTPLAQLSDDTINTEDLILLGKSSILRSALGQDWKSLDTVSTYESDLEDVVYNQIEVAELNGAPGSEFVLIDGQNNVLEIIKWQSPDNWTSALHFNVFEEDIHYGGRTGAPLEPREIMIGDFTGDGRDDIVLLVHDRMLLYPQGEADSESDGKG